MTFADSLWRIILLGPIILNPFHPRYADCLVVVGCSGPRSVSTTIGQRYVAYSTRTKESNDHCATYIFPFMYNRHKAEDIDQQDHVL